MAETTHAAVPADAEASGPAALEEKAKSTIAVREEFSKQCRGEAAAGDPVILWGSYTQIFAVTLQAGAITNNRYGSFHHDDLIGLSYGSKVRPRKGGQWVALLRPNAELITQSLVHRTQIIYHADISLILTLLDVRPGKVIIEAGTGSGSLSASFVRGLRPGGKLHTFEFHEERQSKVAEDFERYGFGDVVISRHGNVCTNGFPGAPTGEVDGAFLDLPMPWQAIPHLDHCLGEGGRVCTFSPCIEQVDKTACELRRGGRYHSIRVFESLAVNWAVKEEPAPKKRRIKGGQAGAGKETEAAEEAPQPQESAQQRPAWTSFQLPMRSHTSYILIATRALPDEP